MLESYHGEERRVSPRAPICLAAAAECDAWMEICFSKDISDSGCFLIAQKLPSIASGFAIDMKLPGKMGILRLRGIVARIQGGSPRGFGVHWKDPSPAEHELLKDLWARWEKAFSPRQA